MGGGWDDEGWKEFMLRCLQIGIELCLRSSVNLTTKSNDNDNNCTVPALNRVINRVRDTYM
jgi:hypothetical protein